jgi:hypothetical protein
MKQVLHILLVLLPMLAYGHSCPYDWNVELSKELSFRESSVSNVINAVNAAVREQTKGRIKQAAILDTTPVKISMVPASSHLTNEMTILVNRYREQMAPIIAKGAQGYETCPVTVTFPRKFPIACTLKMIGQATAEMGYEEKKEGAIFSRWPKELECRAYKVSDALLARVEQKRNAGQIHSDFKPVPVVFAQESGMVWTIMVGDEPNSYRGDFILDAVTYYLPDKKVMLILETLEGHKKVQENLQKLGYWRE